VADALSRGAKHFTPVVQGSVSEPWGFEVRQAPFTGSAHVEIDLGDPN